MAAPTQDTPLEALPKSAAKQDVEVDIEQISIKPQQDTNSPYFRAEHLHGRKLWLAYIGFLMTELMTGLGGNMLASALPVVASRFNALDRIGFASGAFYMAQVGVMLLIGQLCQTFNALRVMQISILLFMVGSAICGGSFNFPTLVVGRVVAGLGAAGCWVTVQVLVAYLVDLNMRPLIMGLTGVQNIISSTAGLVAAGAFASSGGQLWRMCFLIVLPLGTAAIVLTQLFVPSVPPLPIPDAIQQKAEARLRRYLLGARGTVRPWMVRLVVLDWPSCVLCSGAVVCFVLAMTFGGSTYAWGSGTVIGLFVGFFALMGAAVALQLVAIWPMMPLHVWKRRSIPAGSYMSMACFMLNLFGAVFIPIIYEAGFGMSSLHASIHLIPFLVAVVAGQVVSGLVILWNRRYWYWGPTSPVLLLAGAALIYKVTASSSYASLIGYQILYGVGLGCTQGIGIIGVQADSPDSDVAVALSIVAFFQMFGGMCGPTIGSSILDSSLKTKLAAAGFDATTAAALLSSVDTVKTLTGAAHAKAVNAYLESTGMIFMVAMPFAGSILLASFLLRNIKLKSRAG